MPDGIAGDKAHLARLAGELPEEMLGQLVSLVTYAGEEAILALGRDHPRADELNRSFELFREHGEALRGRLAKLADLLDELSRM